MRRFAQLAVAVVVGVVPFAAAPEGAGASRAVAAADGVHSDFNGDFQPNRHPNFHPLSHPDFHYDLYLH